MAKVLVLDSPDKAMIIDGIEPASIITTKDKSGNAIDTVAVEIDNTTEQPAIVAESDSWMISSDDNVLFTADNRLLEHADE